MVESTNKWKSACRTAIEMLHSEISGRGQKCELIDIIKGHNLSPEAIGYNPETEEFE